MVAGAIEAWGPPHQGVVVTPADAAVAAIALPASLAQALVCLVGAHPIPDERSLAAGEALLALVNRLQQPGCREDPVLLLVSGGASSLAEALVPGQTLPALQAMTREALAGGLDIVQLNARRRELSRLKGGALVRALGPERVIALTLSDVPGDSPSLIGSGLACGDAPDSQPAAMACIGKLEDALQGIEAAARADGVELLRLPGRFAGAAAAVAREFVGQLGPGRGLLWGGESTMVLPPAPGRGGRNQHLALEAAVRMAGWPDVALLAAGTDGIDGVTPDAGALVDGGTVRRGEAGAGVPCASALATADSGTFLEAAGDLVHTGPTGTNVGDILVAWWPPPVGRGA